jgi:hypothetical protein
MFLAPHPPEHPILSRVGLVSAAEIDGAKAGELSHARRKDNCHRSTASHNAASRHGAGTVPLAVPMFDGRTRARPLAGSAFHR